MKTLNRRARRREDRTFVAEHEFLNTLFMDATGNFKNQVWYADENSIVDHFNDYMYPLTVKEIQDNLDRHIKIKAITVDYTRSGYDSVHDYNSRETDDYSAPVLVRKIGIKISKIQSYKCPCKQCLEEQGYILGNRFTYKYAHRKAPLVWTSEPDNWKRNLCKVQRLR